LVDSLWLWRSRISRRAVLRLGGLFAASGVATSGVATLGTAPALAKSPAKPPRKLRPQREDRLVFANGARKGEIVRDRDVVLGAAPIQTWPFDAAADVIRDGSRLNRVLLLRVDMDGLSPKAAKRSAAGIVAYSGVCTHTGCDIEKWRPETRQLVCPCHGSRFDALDAAKVASGPAPKPLAMLPIAVVDGELRVVGAFSRRVGFQKP